MKITKTANIKGNQYYWREEEIPTLTIPQLKAKLMELRLKWAAALPAERKLLVIRGNLYKRALESQEKKQSLTQGRLDY